MPEASKTTADTVQVSECRLRLARPIRQYEAPALRGFFGRKFEEEVLMHNHEPDGTPIYQYPRVQFKILDSTALLLGVNEGSELLQRLWLEIDETKLGDEQLSVLESQFETRHEQLEVTAEPIEYRFATPWLALNQNNFRQYTSTRNQRTRKDELSRILVGNCLGLSKSLGIRFSDRIAADCTTLTSIKTSLKGQGMIGFVGKFTVNLTLPDSIGLGKSVSRGFGTVERTGK
ncbi:MAG: CRISPR-associated endonuclease Cas6 [Candidatus Paceibacterota bacterium]